MPSYRRDSMKTPRVLLLLGTDGEWSRGILRGFTAVAQERDWTILHYPPCSNLSWLMEAQAPDVAVLGPGFSAADCARLAPAALVSVTVDRTADGIASVCPDEEGIAALAAEHLLATGLRRVTTFRYDITTHVLTVASADPPLAGTGSYPSIERQE